MLTPITYFALVAFMVYFCAQYVHARGAGKYKHTNDTLPDLMHDILPDLATKRWFMIKDMILVLPLVVILLSKPKNRNPAFLQFISYFTLVILFRCVTTTVTTMPSSLPAHIEKERMGITGLELIYGGSYDQMFSGHTAFFTLATLLIIRYNLLPNIPKELLIAGIGGYVTLIVATRSHYTSDIIVSLLLSYFVFDADLGIKL